MDIHTFIPSYAVEAFEKFASKTKKNVAGFDYKLSKPYQKVFRHSVIQANGMAGRCQKVFHEVCDLTIIQPEERQWRLLATYKDDNFLPADPSKEIVYKNPKHGRDYGVCDVCGHWCKNSYVIENIKTGDELQVGCECAKKFGIKSFEYLSRFNHDLYALYDYRISYAIDDEFGGLMTWGGKKDTSWMTAHETRKLIMAAKKEYDNCPIWKKGGYVSGYWQPSVTGKHIVQFLNSNDIIIDEQYTTRLCEFTLAQESTTPFQDDMHYLANNFYCHESQAVHAFFMVKAYEESKKKVNVNIGMQVKVEGKVVQTVFKDGFYGRFETNTILTDNGTECIRIGAIPRLPDEYGNDSERTSFYAIVRDVYKNKVYLERATKKPKKGIEITTI